MTAMLRDILLAPHVRPQVAAECCLLVDQQVAAQHGVSGAAVKLACKTVNTFRPGHIGHMVQVLLPEMADQLEPYWAGFCASASAGSRFGDYLASCGAEVSHALLAVTDARAAASGRPVVIKAYQAVRGSAARHVEDALPRIGDLVQKYAT